ncbi:MAG: S1/P1 nuclease [Caulobacter sp.]|nr:S1/P1 nuclease [Caulobacter sp.]
MRTVAFCLFSLAFLFLGAPQAKAWGDYGHIAVCEMAYDMLTAPARAEVDRILKKDGEYSTFKVACTDEDNPPKLRRLEHFFNLPRDRLFIDGTECPQASASPCLISAIMKDWTALRSGQSSDATKAAKLKGLGHWVGDIHQPLHISFADDQGGNLINANARCSYGLHSAWDTCIFVSRFLKIVITKETPFAEVLDRITAVSGDLRKGIRPEERAAWGDDNPWQWAKESYQIALQPGVSYCIMTNGECWYDDERRTYQGGRKRSVRVTDEYLDAYAPVVEQRLSQAAVRLAHMLNVAFDPAYPPAEP